MFIIILRIKKEQNKLELKYTMKDYTITCIIHLKAYNDIIQTMFLLVLLKNVVQTLHRKIKCHTSFKITPPLITTFFWPSTFHCLCLSGVQPQGQSTANSYSIHCQFCSSKQLQSKLQFYLQFVSCGKDVGCHFFQHCDVEQICAVMLPRDLRKASNRFPNQTWAFITQQ